MPGTIVAAMVDAGVAGDRVDYGLNAMLLRVDA
jgi:hypothetical protein